MNKEQFINEWGQPHEAICSELSYDPKTADDLLMVDYFFYENFWFPKSSSLYSDEEQEFANNLRLAL